MDDEINNFININNSLKEDNLKNRTFKKSYKNAFTNFDRTFKANIIPVTIDDMVQLENKHEENLKNVEIKYK
jgi:hypothetical protein